MALASDIPGLTGAQRDAAAALTNIFEQYGLSSLAPRIVAMLQEGFGSDTIAVALQDAPEYKARFAANDARIKAGLPALSPAEYLATERSYRQLMSQAGLPLGFYDQPSDFQKFLEQDISPTELKQRVDTASDAINNAAPGTLDYMRQWYNTGDLIAYALDPTRATTLIDQRIKAAEAGAAAQRQNLNINQGTAEDLARQGFTSQQLQAGFGEVAATAATTNKLGAIYGQQVTQDDVIAQVFNNDAAATEKVRKLASQERASFGGTSSTTSLSGGSGI